MDPFLAILEKNRKILQPFKIHIKISGGHGRESAKKKIHRTGLMGCKKFFEAKKCELAPGYTHVHLTLIHKFWKKSKTRDRHRCVFRKKNPERSIASICICFRALDLFSGKHARLRSKWHIILFSVADFLSYWHIPFEISIIIQPNWHSICTYNFHFLSLNCDATSDDFGFVSEMTLGKG